MDSAVKQRAVIEFLVKLGEVSPTKIHDKLRAVYKEETMSVSTLRRWVLRFRNGEESISDKPRSGRPSSASTPETVEKVNGLIMQNRRIRVRDLAMQVGCSTGTIVNIINQLNYRKVCARWVPKLLTQEQKDARRDISSDLLRAYRNAGEEFFRGTVTGDESWIHHYQPETRRQSMEWKHPGSPAPKKVKSVTSAGKIMVTIFWDEDGVLLVDFLEHGGLWTVTAISQCWGGWEEPSWRRGATWTSRRSPFTTTPDRTRLTLPARRSPDWAGTSCPSRPTVRTWLRQIFTSSVPWKMTFVVNTLRPTLTSCVL